LWSYYRQVASAGAFVLPGVITVAAALAPGARPSRFCSGGFGVLIVVRGAGSRRVDHAG
jgi:hypothetical protein